MRRLLATFTMTTAFAVLVGCGGDSHGDVSGNVKIDGKPLPAGDIIFESTDGSAPVAHGKIKDGQYSLKSAPGAKKVKITATRPGKNVDPAMGAAPQEAMIGPEYNSNTKLTADVKPGTNPNVNFDVKALP